jgi:hypothetical protein
VFRARCRVECLVFSVVQENLRQYFQSFNIGELISLGLLDTCFTTSHSRSLQQIMSLWTTTAGVSITETIPCSMKEKIGWIE